jgi:predicted ATPase/class 3 adenylate cyclase
VLRRDEAATVEFPSGTLTFLFTDLERSTGLWEEHPEAMKRALARHDRILRDAVEGHGGHVVKTTGDGVHAVFGSAHEALEACLDAQSALAGERWPESTGPLRVRMGVHAGEAELRDRDYYGSVLNRAARLMAVGYGGQVLVSETVEPLVRDALPADATLIDLGMHRLRDLADPLRVFQLAHPDLPREFPRLRSLDALPGNLPRQVTSFVGREDELARVADELEEAPLVTLTGVGGVGKTRVALEVAAAVIPNLRDGAWLCELDGVRDPEAVSDAVIEVFGLDPRPGMTATDLVLSFLGAKQLLLVLDNCEHVLKPIARLVTQVVRECPGVHVLATSREGLNVAGERILVVASLELPDSTELPAIASSEAVQLFVERAEAVRAGFALDATNASAVAQICHRLDGVPLAIELAAARVSMLAPPELARRLDQRFRILTGSDHGAVERHQTLRAAIDWSYELLDDTERRLLDRLSVFAGGFTLQAAEAVASGEGINADAVFDLLAALVARSLVEADTEGVEARYRLLETIRQYAQERLEADGDAARVRDEHARHFAAFGKAAIAGLASPAELDWWQRFSREIDNVRVALTWAIENREVEITLRLMALDDARLVTFSPELSAVLRPAAEAALAMPGIVDDPRYPTVLLCAAMHCYAQEDLEGVARYCDDALAAEARLGVDPNSSVWTTRVWIALTEGNVDEYVEYAERALAICRGRDEGVRLAMALTGAAMAHSLRGDDMEEAIAEVDEALTLAKELAIPSLLGGTRASAAFVLADVQPERALVLMREALQDKKTHRIRGLPVHSILGDVAERLGDQRHALEFFAIGMEEQHWLGNSEMVGRMLRRVGLRLVDHDPESAALTIGAGTAFSHGWTLTTRVVEDQERGIEALNAALGADRCAKLLDRGAAMDEHDAVVEARAAAARTLSAVAPSSKVPRT